MRPLQFRATLIIITILCSSFVFGGLSIYTATEISSYHLKKTNELMKDPKVVDEVFLRNWQKQIEYKEKKLKMYALILFLTIVTGLVYLRQFFIKNVFTPLFGMTVKMLDFLNGEYSYKFETPTTDEMGRLQSTFDSMAQEVLENMKELKALDEAKSDFLNIASHELRTPMTSIKGSLGLLTSGALGKLPSEVMNLTQIAENETDRLIRLTNDILDMAKIEARKMDFLPKWFSINGLIEKTLFGLEGLQKTSGIDIKSSDIPSFEIYADEDRIQQVLTNLLSNAIKFSPKNKPVEILVENSGSNVKIIVRDHGKGMSPEQKSVLFQKFRQVSSPDNPLVKGTGLGLAISKAIIEEHEGTIGVESKPNEGSAFYFTLPEWRQGLQKDKAS